MNKSKIIAISLSIFAFSSFSFSAQGSGKGPEKELGMHLWRRGQTIRLFLDKLQKNIKKQEL